MSFKQGQQWKATDPNYFDNMNNSILNSFERSCLQYQLHYSSVDDDWFSCNSTLFSLVLSEIWHKMCCLNPTKYYQIGNGA